MDGFERSLKMKRLIQIMTLSLSLLSLSEGAEKSYHSVWSRVEVSKITSMKVAYGREGESFDVKDVEIIKELMSTITKKDFPVRKGPIGMSLPGIMCEVKFYNGSLKEVAHLSVYAAWNLINAKRGQSQFILGSNKDLCIKLFSYLEKNDSTYTNSLKNTYKKHLSGVYAKEYRDSF